MPGLATGLLPSGTALVLKLKPGTAAGLMLLLTVTPGGTWPGLA